MHRESSSRRAPIASRGSSSISRSEPGKRSASAAISRRGSPPGFARSSKRKRRISSYFRLSSTSSSGETTSMALLDCHVPCALRRSKDPRTSDDSALSDDYVNEQPVMSDHKREIDELRRQMADVDAQLLVGLEKRAKASKAIGALLGDQPPQLSLQDRPQIDALVARSSGDMPAESLRTIFRTVYAACLGLQAPVTVAYLGPGGGP